MKGDKMKTAEMIAEEIAAENAELELEAIENGIDVDDLINEFMDA